MIQSEARIIDNLKEFLGLKKDKELCELLDIKPNTISTWKKRKTLDYKKIIELCSQKKLSLDQVFFRNETSNNSLQNTSSFSEKIEKAQKIKLNNTNRNILVFKNIDEQELDCKVMLTQRIIFSKMKPACDYVIVLKVPAPQIIKCFFIKYASNESIYVISNTGEKKNISRYEIDSVWAILGKIYMD